jgi:hypothetical protein
MKCVLGLILYILSKPPSGVAPVDSLWNLPWRPWPQEVHVSCVDSGITSGAAGTPVGSKASQPVLPRLGQIDVKEKQQVQEGHIKAQVNGKDYNLLVSFLPTNHGQSIAMHFLSEACE